MISMRLQSILILFFIFFHGKTLHLEINCYLCSAYSTISLMKRLLLIFIATLLNMAVTEASELRNLKVNRMLTPYGIVRTGQFSWQIASEENNVRQLAYHIRVASTEEGLQGGPTMMWDSERRESADMIQVYYQGRRFPYDSTIYWQLDVWLSNNEHLQSPVQKIKTGSKGQGWNESPVTKADVQHDYFFYRRWLHTLMMNQAESGELQQPVPDDTSAIPVDQVAAVLYSLFKEEGDVKALYDYYNMVRQWMTYRCQKDSTVSTQLIHLMSEMAQRQNLQADVHEYSRLKGDSITYEPYWLYADEPAWCRGAIRQAESSIAYNRVELTIPSIGNKNSKDSISHECPYGTIHSKWSRAEGKTILWEIMIPVGVQARVHYPKDYADEEGKTSKILGSGKWEIKLSHT